MTQIFLNVPLTRWVRGTIEKMNGHGRRDIHSWGAFWLETYTELGGRSDSSGSKECPKHAAYGLWMMGMIKDSGIASKPTGVKVVNQEFGRNATYAVLALDLLRKQPKGWTDTGLWKTVQDAFRNAIHEEPAISSQGAVKIARILFEEGQII